MKFDPLARKFSIQLERADLVADVNASASADGGGKATNSKGTGVSSDHAGFMTPPDVGAHE